MTLNRKFQEKFNAIVTPWIMEMENFPIQLKNIDIEIIICPLTYSSARAKLLNLLHENKTFRQEP